MNTKNILFCVSFFSIFFVVCISCVLAGGAKTNKKEPVPQQGKAEATRIQPKSPYQKSYRAGSFRVAMGNLKTGWEAGDFRANEKKINIMRIGSIGKKIEFSLLPPEIDELNKIGNVNQYKFRSLTNVNLHGSGFSPANMKITCYYPRLMKNQIIVIRNEKECVAIKFVDLKPVYNSRSELPEYMRDGNWKEKYLYKDDSDIPDIWKSVVYEWKYLSLETESIKTVSVESYEVKQGISKIHLMEKSPHYRVPSPGSFYVPGIGYGVRFSFLKEWHESEGKDSKGQIHPWKGYILSLSFDIESSFLVEEAYQGCASGALEDIKDPSKIFEDHSLHLFFKIPEVGYANDYMIGGMGSPLNGSVPRPDITVLRLDNRYVAIKPLKIEGDQVTYEWKYWPNVIPSKELAKTALNK